MFRMAGNHGRTLSQSFGNAEVGSSASFWLVGAHRHAPSWLRWCQSTWLDSAGWIGHQTRMRGCGVALGGLGGSLRSRQGAPVGGHTVMSASDVRGYGMCIGGLANMPQ